MRTEVGVLSSKGVTKTEVQLEHARELGGAHKLVQPEDPVPDALRSRL